VRALTVVFDEGCGVCQACVAWLKRRDRAGALRFLGNQAETLPAGVPREQTGETIFVVDESTGRARTRADGVAWILRTLPGWRAAGWRLLGGAMGLPGSRQLANAAYRLFARHRHQVSAALGMNRCAVPEKPR